jgi:L,D-transpeptidase ErfK/SrfK
VLALAGVMLGGCAGEGGFGSFSDLWRTPPAEPQPMQGPMPWQRGDVIGTSRTLKVEGEETLVGLARPNNLGYVELLAANPGVDPWLPGVGTELVLPTIFVLPPGPREGIVINLPEQRLYYFPKDGLPVTHPIGIGRDGYETPLGQTKVVRKKAGPSWYPPQSARADDPTLGKVVPPGPDNPLGTHALYLAWPQYLIHGTNKPDGIGRRVSRGCIRMYPEDIAALFETVPKGTPVRVISAPVKLGWSNGNLYMEVHPTIDQADAIEQTGHFTPKPVSGVRDLVAATAGDQTGQIDWSVVDRELVTRRGVPVRITRDAIMQASSDSDVGRKANWLTTRLVVIPPTE